LNLRYCSASKNALLLFLVVVVVDDVIIQDSDAIEEAQLWYAQRE